MTDLWHRHHHPGFDTRRAVGLFISVAAVALAIAWWQQPSTVKVNGQNCARLTVGQQFTAADLVLTGTVFMVIPSNAGAEVIISPERVYRGQLPTRGIRIVAQSNTPGMGSPAAGQESEINFSSNQSSYLLFLHERTDGRYDTRACFGTRLLGTGLTLAEREVLGSGQVVIEP